jgi:hypothetical protein
VLGVILAVVFTPLFAWTAIKALRNGTAGPKNLPVTRSAQPVLFWTCVAMSCAAATLFAAFAVFSATYRPNTLSDIETAGLGIATLCFGVMFVSIAGVTGYYTAQGFRAGTAIFVWQGGADFHDRKQSPGWYWETQIQNILMTAFLGSIGLGAIGVALFFTLGPLLLG